jgi:hypothetical protein
MRKIYKFLFMLFIFALIGIQFIDAPITNPPVTGEIEAPIEIKAMLKTSCYDCHSNETVWPWYSKVAPISWLIIDDVNNGRKRVNFSEWNKYSNASKEKKMKEIWEEINTDEMPIKSYTFLHPKSVIDFNQKSLFKKWVSNWKTFF